MSGRRSHYRYEVVHSPEGVLRVMRDIVVQHAGSHEVIAISREPGVLGESVTVEVSVDDAVTPVTARVVESQPVVVGGSVRHRLRLEPVGAAL